MSNAIYTRTCQMCGAEMQAAAAAGWSYGRQVARLEGRC